MRGALLVGIDHYKHSPLNGCINDATSLAKSLINHENGERNFEIRLITSDKFDVSRSFLKKEIELVFSKQEEVALFYFSGHGTENNLGGYIITQDATKYDEGISLTDVLQYANDSPATERIVILDSCHSGHLGALPGIKNGSSLSQGVTVITATKSSEKAIQQGGSSLFTSLLLDAINGGAADVLGKVNIASVYSYIDNILGYFDQRPLYKAHVSKLINIKNCHPSVEREIFRKLPSHFPTNDSLYQLDPSFERTSPLANKDDCEIMLEFQKCRAAGLLEPLHPTLHLYDAAMNSEYCRLTRLGKYYWLLAAKDKI